MSPMCKVSVISAFCQSTTQTPSITNCLVASKGMWTLTFLQQNLPVLNCGCRLTQVDLYNCHKTYTAVVVPVLLLLRHELTWREPGIFLTLQPSRDNPHVFMLPFLLVQKLLNHHLTPLLLFLLLALILQCHITTHQSWKQATLYCTPPYKHTIHTDTRVSQWTLWCKGR